MPVVEVVLDAGEAFFTQSGGMCYMSEGIEMSTSTRGGLMKGLGRMLAGESLTMTTYTGDWELTNNNLNQNQGFSCSFISVQKRA